MRRAHRIAFALLALVLLLSVLDAAPARAFYNEGSQVPLTWSGRCYDPDNDLAVHPISGMTNAEALASLPRLTLDSAWLSFDDGGYDVVIPGSAYNGERIFVFPAGTEPAEMSSVNVAGHPDYITLSETTLYAVDVYLVSGGEGSWLMSDEAAALAAEGRLVYEAEVAPAFASDTERSAWWAAFLADHPEVEGVIGVQTTPVSVFDGVANVSEGGWLGGIPSLCVFPAAPPTTTTTTTTTPPPTPPTTEPCSQPDNCESPHTGPTGESSALRLAGPVGLLLLLVSLALRPRPVGGESDE